MLLFSSSARVGTHQNIPAYVHGDLCLLDEVLFRHCSFTNGLDGYFSLPNPVAQMDHPKLAAADLLDECELIRIYDPFSCG